MGWILNVISYEKKQIRDHSRTVESEAMTILFSPHFLENNP
jgi:hypothetical protein